MAETEKPPAQVEAAGAPSIDSILALMVAVGRTSSTAALLNIPYLAWVSVAACLNLRIVQLNPRRSLA